MSIRLEMIQVARLAPKLLGDSTQLIEEYLLGQRHAAGGFVNREGMPDLYYSVFAFDALQCLQSKQPLDGFADYLKSFECGDSLDFVHFCCLVRCASMVLGKETPKAPFLERLWSHRSADGGFHPQQGIDESTAYATFLAVGALQDLGCDLLSIRSEVVASLDGLRAGKLAWSNERAVAMPSTNATAAALTTLRQFDCFPDTETTQWILQMAHPMGGFLAAPQAPIPDLLSTATALHALSGDNQLLELSLRERCLDFLDSLWSNVGGFHGHWQEDHIDPEYTFYGLLALGHLSVSETLQ